jgi:hypothetical protein
MIISYSRCKKAAKTRESTRDATQQKLSRKSKAGHPKTCLLKIR